MKLGVRSVVALVAVVALWSGLAAAQTGTITGVPGKPGVVVAAPHGTVDMNTDQIAETIAKRTGFGLVVATGYAFSRDETRYRLDVNRPTEGRIGGGERSESAEAATVYASYRARVEAVAQGPLVLYIEIHGNVRQESAGNVEIATTGIDVAMAEKLRGLLEAAQDARPDVQKLRVLVEPADAIFYRATAAKRHGILALPKFAVHIELPRATRMAPDGYAEVLADFLAGAARLLLAP